MSLKEIDEILNEENELENDTDTNSIKKETFKCLKCGKVESEQVLFICNKCDSKEMVHVGDVNMCPKCFEKGKNFMCLNCDSLEVNLDPEIKLKK
jgi:Zn finger protein HypA/HybF involved in hydrogenase expression